MVVTWRKRELNEWKLILESTILIEARKSVAIFPEIFSALEASNDGNLDAVRLVIVNLLNSSNCANFQHRLKMVDSLADLFLEKRPHATNLLRNIANYFRFWSIF